MSIEIINEYDVFEHHTIKPADIQYLYKPYGELCSSNPEEAILAGMAKGKKVIIRSFGGSGKSCLINYVVSKLDTSYLPIMLPVWIGSDVDQICTDASDFVAFILHGLLSAVREAKKVTQAEYESYRKYLSGELSFREGKKNHMLAKLRAKLT